MGMNKHEGVEYQIEQLVTNFNALLDAIKGSKAGTVNINNETSSTTVISSSDANALKL